MDAGSPDFNNLGGDSEFITAGSPNYDDIDNTNVTVRKKREGIRIRKRGRIPMKSRFK
jgi:hypothetical protein